MDNQSTMTIAQNPEFHNRTKHIKVQYHFLRLKVKDSELVLAYIPTEEQIADVLTKALCWEKHLRFSEGMDIQH